MSERIGHVVTTINSTYIVDYRDNTLTRYPGVGLTDDSHELHEYRDVRELRKDRTPIRLVGVVEPLTVGEPAVFVIDLEIDGVMVTTRATSPIVRVENLTEMTIDEMPRKPE